MNLIIQKLQKYHSKYTSPLRCPLFSLVLYKISIYKQSTNLLHLNIFLCLIIDSLVQITCYESITFIIQFSCNSLSTHLFLKVYSFIIYFIILLINLIFMFFIWNNVILAAISLTDRFLKHRCFVIRSTKFNNISNILILSFDFENSLNEFSWLFNFVYFFLLLVINFHFMYWFLIIIKMYLLNSFQHEWTSFPFFRKLFELMFRLEILWCFVWIKFILLQVL